MNTIIPAAPGSASEAPASDVHTEVELWEHVQDMAAREADYWKLWARDHLLPDVRRRLRLREASRADVAALSSASGLWMVDELIRVAAEAVANEIPVGKTRAQCSVCGVERFVSVGSHIRFESGALLLCSACKARTQHFTLGDHCPYLLRHRRLTARVRSAVDAKGISVKALSVLTDIPYVTLTRHFDGGPAFTVSEVGAIATALGVPTWSLMQDVA